MKENTKVVLILGVFLLLSAGVFAYSRNEKKKEIQKKIDASGTGGTTTEHQKIQDEINVILSAPQWAQSRSNWKALHIPISSIDRPNGLKNVIFNGGVKWSGVGRAVGSWMDYSYPGIESLTYDDRNQTSTFEDIISGAIKVVDIIL